MFSFRELVESMEEKTFERVSPILRAIRPPQSGISNDVPQDCKNIEKQQTSQHRTEATDEKDEGSMRREGLWKYSESQEELEQRKGVSREEEVVQASRTDGQSASSKIMDTESLQVMQQEIEAPPTFKRKHFSLTSRHQTFSVNDLCDAVQRNHCTLLQKAPSLPDSVYQEPSFGKQDFDISTTSFQLEHQPISSAQSCKYEREHSLDQDLLTQASRCLNENKNVQAGKCRYLKTCRRAVRRMDTKCMIRGRVCQVVKHKKRLNLSDENISEDEEVTNVCSTEVKEQRGSRNNYEHYTSHDSHFHETQNSSQYVEVCRQEMPVKETVTLTKHPESHKAASKGACDLSSFVKDCLYSTDAAAMSLLVNMNVYSDNNKNTPSLQTRDGYEWTSHNFRDFEELQTFKGSKYASKHDEKASDSIRKASRSELDCSESASHVPSSLWTSDNNAKKLIKQSEQEKTNNFRNQKYFKERGAGSVKGLQDDKVRKIKRYRSSTTKGRVPTTYNENASIRGNEGPRSSSSSSSPLGFRCQMCSSWWRDEASLGRHQRLHATARPFACSDCPSRFNQLVHLQIHRRTHTGEKPFRCGTCNASFSRKDRLRSHERRHSGEQPYTCPYCPASFRDAASLRSHVPVHAHQPPFTCRICSATFAHLSTFTSHWRLHN